MVNFDQLRERLGSNTIQFLTYAAVMVTSIFVPILARELGASNWVVGVTVAVYFSAFLVSSLIFGGVADRYGGRVIFPLGLFLSALAFALHLFVRDVFTLIFVRGLTGFTLGMYPAALAAYAYEERAGKMGQFSGYGSLGWAAGSVLAGLIAAYPPLFAVSSVLFFIAFFISFELGSTILPREKIISPWLFLRRNFELYFQYFLRGLGANAIWAIFPLYLWSLGANKFWIGVAYFLNVFSQFFLMQWVEKFRNRRMINLGLLGTVFAFLGYALAPSWIWVMPVQIILAFSFSALQVGSLQELMQNNPEKSTAAGLLNSTVNLAAVVGPLLAGGLAEIWDYRAVMWAGALFSAAAFLFTRRRAI